MPTYGSDDPLYQEDPSWLGGQAANQPTTPQAQASAPSSPWLDSSTTPTQAPAPTQTPQATAAPAASSFTQDMGPQSSWTPQTDVSAGTGAATSAQQPVSLANYQGLVDAVNNAADPQARTVAHDTLARQVQSDLEADGHKVSWKGDQLMVDGRAYELGASSTAPSSSLVTTQPAGIQPMAGGGAQPLQATAPPASYNSPPLDAGTQQLISTYISSNGLKADQSDPTSLLNLVGYLRAQGKNAQVDYADQNGHTGGILIDGHPYQMIDGSNNWTAAQPWDQSAGGGAGQTDLTASPFANGGGNLPDWLKNPTADPDLMALSQSIPGWQDIYSTLSKTDPQEQQTADLVQQILQHPESLDARTIEELKAKNAEETASAAQSQDQDLQHFGYNNGLDQSPWLAGQRANTAWNSRSSIIAGNRNVDISAAETNTKDRLAAAGLGKDWATYRQGKSVQAINTAFEAASAKGTLEQAAKSLGMTKAQLSIAYIGQNLSYDINLKTLKQKGEQFASELAQRIAEMKLHDQEFLDSLQLNRDQFALDKQKADVA